jgi:CheY-like chemotaxis protein
MHKSTTPDEEMLRVLVVDDNADIADALSSLLELQGCEVRVANSGEVGVKIAAEFKPQLTFLDIGLPGMSGYEAARLIRSEPSGAQMKLVALTGYSQTSDQEKTAAAGFDLHLIKPARLDQIREIINDI